MNHMHTHGQMAALPRQPWRLAVCALAVASLAGCASVSSLSQKWSQWRGKSTPAPAAAVAAAPAPAVLHPTTETARWQGMYRHEADSGRFLECKTGQSVPVLMEGDNALLENAFLVARNGQTTAMLATVDGRIVERPAADPVLAQQGKKELALRVERFVTLSSATTCAGGKAAALGVPDPVVAGAAAATGGASADTGNAKPAAAQPTASLDNTYWKLLTLNGKAVPRLDKEAHIILQGQGKLVGSGGCNRLMGSWKQDGSQLQIGQVAGTRMACRGAAASTESALLKMLGQVASWRIHGEQLELLDAKGKLLAQFQAVALR